MQVWRGELSRVFFSQCVDASTSVESLSPRVTLFSLPKPMKPGFAELQRNAWRSWVRQSPRPSIVLVGDEDGVGEWCMDYRHSGCFQHAPGVRYNELRIPMLRSIFEAALKRRPSDDVYAFVNSDMILAPDFMPAVLHVHAAMGSRPFLLVGRRSEMRALPEIRELEWSALFQRAKLSPAGVQTAIDYFVFSAQLYKSDIADLSLCFTWDNWLLSQVRTHMHAGAYTHARARARMHVCNTRAHAHTRRRPVRRTAYNTRHVVHPMAYNARASNV